MNAVRIALVTFVVLLLSACGSTSGMKKGGEKAMNVDLSMYDSVVVLDFTDGTEKQNMPAFAGEKFADLIAAEVKETAAFSQVSRELVPERSIVIQGKVTRYEKGNAVMRAMIGLGAGSAYFDAEVNFDDTETGDHIGEIIVDKNSWGLGGFVAAAQSVDGFMQGAAESIAKELEEAKNIKKD